MSENEEKKKILKFWCLEKNRKTIFILQNISLYKNPVELFYYLDDKDNMGCEKGKKILKLDLKYFCIKFSTLITARLSDLRGTFVQGTKACGTSQRDAMDQEKSLPLFWCFIIFPV